MNIFEGITFGIALLGAALGVLNTLTSLDKSRVKLRVVPKWAVPAGGSSSPISFCIEVTNLSAFAVTVSEVGFHLENTDDRGSLAQPILLDGGAWPRRLEPRSSVTAYSVKPELNRDHPIRCAFARTECGVVKSGSSPALKQLIQEQA